MMKESDYGVLVLTDDHARRNRVNGRFLKGHVPANKGKHWADYMGKRAQKRAAKGWRNLESHRPKHRPDTAGRCRKRVICLTDDGKWFTFPYVGAAAEWLGSDTNNIARCCRLNQSRQQLHDVKGRLTTRINTDHRYKGYRWYYDTDPAWLEKIKKD